MGDSAETNKAYEDLIAAGYDVTKEEVKEALHGARDDYGRDNLKDPDVWWEKHHPKGFQRLQEYLHDDDDEPEEKSSNSGGCYIATASLQGAMTVEVLNPLKEWRYTILERSSLGGRLSNYYRRTAPEVAKMVSEMPILGTVLRTLIVNPAVRIANRPRNLANNILLYVLFAVGLSIAEFIRFTNKR